MGGFPYNHLQSAGKIANVLFISIMHNGQQVSGSMKLAVISDIHGNAAAFREVLRDIERAGISTIYCLGDSIGYGPEPDEVIRMVRERSILSIQGNHELAVNQPGYLNWFNPIARISLEKTLTMLSRKSLDDIAGLPFFLTGHNCRFVHGFPPDSATTYLFEADPEQVDAAMTEAKEPICFVGHTHELMIVIHDGREVSRHPLKRETIMLDTGCRYIINVGSVGQPRDGTNHAKYVIFDDQALELEVRFVDYNVTETIDKIYAAGLPEQHAWRLF